MKTQCKSCKNWTKKDGDYGWCVNFKKEMFNNSLCGEWRAREREKREVDSPTETRIKEPHV